MSGGLDLCRFPAKLANFSDMSAEVHVQAQNFPISRSKLTHWTKKKGGKNVHFLKTMEARCLDAIWVSGVVQYNPQGCLAKFYGLGCWGWAVVGSDS